MVINGTCGCQGKRQIFSRQCCVLVTWAHLWLRQTVLALLRAPDGEADLSQPLGRLRQPAPAALRLHARDLHLVIFFVETLNNIFNHLPHLHGGEVERDPAAGVAEHRVLALHVEHPAHGAHVHHAGLTDTGLSLYLYLSFDYLQSIMIGTRLGSNQTPHIEHPRLSSHAAFMKASS